MIYFNESKDESKRVVDMLMELLIDIFLEGVDDNENDSGICKMFEF